MAKNFIIRGRKWVAKEKTTISSEEDCNFVYHSKAEDREWIRRTVVATLESVQSIETIQDNLWSNGLTSLGGEKVGGK